MITLGEDNHLQDRRRKQGGRANTNNSNRVELRLPKKGWWVYDSMKNYFWKEGYITKPTINELARLCINIVANDYMMYGQEIAHQHKEIIPIRDNDKLEQELNHTKSALGDEKEISSAFKDKIEIQSNTINHISSVLKEEREELDNFKVFATAIGKKLLDIAKEGVYPLRQWSEIPRVIVNDWQSSLTKSKEQATANKLYDVTEADWNIMEKAIGNGELTSDNI
jgi:hypothetical protein